QGSNLIASSVVPPFTLTFNATFSQTYYLELINSNNVLGCTTSVRTPVAVTVHPIPVPPIINNNNLITNCGPGRISIIATNFNGGAKGIRLYTVATGGNPIAEDIRAESPNIVGVNVQTNTQFYISAFDPTSGCESSTRERVFVFINGSRRPSPPIVSNLIGGVMCIGLGNTVAIQAQMGSIAGSEMRLYTQEAGGTPIAVAVSSPYHFVLTPSQSMTYFLSAADLNTSCESERVPVPVILGTRLFAPTTNVATLSRCDVGEVTFTLSSTFGALGNFVRLYTQAVGGTPVGSYSATPTVTGASYTVVTPSVTTNTTFFASTYDSNTGCESADRTRLNVIVHPKPSTPASQNVGRCSIGEVIFTVQMGAIPGNQIRLYASATSSIPVSTNITDDPYTVSTGNLGLGSTTFYLSAYNTVTQCESNRLAVVAVVSNGVVPPQSIVSRQVGCSLGSVTFTVTLGNATASLLSGNGVRLYTVPTGGTPVATDVEGPYTLTTPPIGFTKVFYIAAFDRASGCESERIPATATILSTVPSTPSASADAICSASATSVQISVTQGDIIGNEVRLYTRALGGTPVATTSTEPYILITPSLTQTTTFFVAAGAGNCESIRRQIVVTVNPFPTAPIATATTSCDGSVITISASLTNTVVGAEIRVYSGMNDIAPIAVITRAPYEVTVPNTGATTYYVASAVAGNCESPRRAVVVNRGSAISVTANATPTTCRSLASVNAFATGAGPFQFRLYNVATGSLVMMNTTGVFSAVEPGRYYVEANNTAGCRGRTVDFEIQGPEAPRNITVSNITQSTAVVSWASDNTDIIDFEIRYRLEGNNNYERILRVSASTTSLTLTNLQPGTNYEVEVRGICNTGRQTEWGSTTFSTTRSGGEGICVTPTNIRVIATSPNTATVSWTPNLAGAFCYIVSYGPAGTRPDNWAQFLVTHPMSTLNITNLVAGVNYAVQIRTNCSDCSLRSGFITEPSAPVTFSTTAKVAEDLASSQYLQVYPNPNKGHFAIVFNVQESANVQISIMDLTGRKIYERYFDAVMGENEIPLSLEDAPKGIYLVQFRQGASTAFTKVTIN
ncbi:MAG: fibronectin type III domain-containing protein, partial [Bacteroidia bacterium]|nr:fibronectin type III domain-containing protein [Bacteroidia bacterium]MDW8159281.1 fibronectin type III domain-containing protein [Bacteroidia bacterium]